MRYFQDGKELVALNAKTWDFGPSVTKFRDGVNGEKRNRTGSQTDHYELNLELWVDDRGQVDTFLTDRDNEDAEAIPLDKSALVQLCSRPHRSGRFGRDLAAADGAAGSRFRVSPPWSAWGPCRA